ncbi:MAG: autotransporter assembly complex family protein [Pseudomonadota bacterium]
MTSGFLKSLAFIGSCCLLAPLGSVADGLQIKGLEGELADNARAFVSLGNENCDSARWIVQRRFTQMEKELRESLQPFGYYSPVIETSLERNAACWSALATVAPGEPVRISELNLSVAGAAKQDGAFAPLLGSPSLRIGQVLDHRRYESTKSAWFGLALERGYFRATWEKSALDVWPETHSAKVSLELNSGPRFTFGDIELQQDILDDDVIARYIKLQSGQNYLADDLARLQRNLNASGYFESVRVLPRISAKSSTEVPVEVALTPAQRTSYRLGLGFSSDTGPRFRGGYDNRRINRRGHQLSSDLRVSSVLSELSANYRRPLRDPSVEWLSYSLGLQAEDTETSESQSYSLGMRRVVRLGSDWLRTDGLSLQFDEFTVGSLSEDSRLLMPSIGFSRKSSNSRVNPLDGTSLRFQLRGASDSLASSTSFAQLSGQFKWIKSLGGAQRLLARVSFGTTLKDDFDELPPSVRFFAGGNESVRGFGFEQLGPEDNEGLVIGGSHLLTASLEFERTFYKQFSWAAFVDAGNAFDGTQLEARVGAGLGLKWRSPLGPLRVYLAHPLNYSTRAVRLHISLGPDL